VPGQARIGAAAAHSATRPGLIAQKPALPAAGRIESAKGGGNA